MSSEVITKFRDVAVKGVNYHMNSTYFLSSVISILQGFTNDLLVNSFALPFLYSHFLGCLMRWFGAEALIRIGGNISVYLIHLPSSILFLPVALIWGGGQRVNPVPPSLPSLIIRYIFSTSEILPPPFQKKKSQVMSPLSPSHA